ncbi:hypothetical protein DEJ44_23220 [Streptomyces venezuelae]|uniref:hypothetical protein n=1 Tax=Streptomyces venezuelae TaxID=54571 RepID=UPI00123874CD|nr:hypothetical protein [Streptomyces venezuelae]QES08240.1 hypothetical protein DEJ44_23220 [Streptomyces venezuelae]
MISNIIQTSNAGSVSAARFVSTVKMTDRSVASTCSLGVSVSAFIGTGLSAAGLAGLGMRPAVEFRNERPTKALEAGAAVKAKAYDFAATGAGTQQQTTTHDHKMWAFRGLEPWSDPV